jgi:hypothetical protein
MSRMRFGRSAADADTLTPPSYQHSECVLPHRGEPRGRPVVQAMFSRSWLSKSNDKVPIVLLLKYYTYNRGATAQTLSAGGPGLIAPGGTPSSETGGPARSPHRTKGLQGPDRNRRRNRLLPSWQQITIMQPYFVAYSIMQPYFASIFVARPGRGRVSTFDY